MTEAEWAVCANVMPMLIYLRGEVEPTASQPDPRTRLITGHGDLVEGEGRGVNAKRLCRFAQHCCRGWWKLPLDATSRRLVTTHVLFLAGIGSWDEYLAVCRHTFEALAAGEQALVNCHMVRFPWSLTPFGVASLAFGLAWATTFFENPGVSGQPLFQLGPSAAVLEPLAGRLREIVGNPFRTTTLDPAALNWNHGAVPTIARRIDDERAFHDLPILAKVLEGAGCSDPDILSHCRQPGVHVRGCWVVDLVLGKE